MQGRRGDNDDVGPLGRWAVREHFVSGAYISESTCPIVFKFHTQHL